jgi:hypothetical protein
LYVTIHLDYGLKGRDPDGDGVPNNYDKAGNGDAVDPLDPSVALIPNGWEYEFSVGGAMTHSDVVTNFNEFKKFLGFAGLVQDTAGPEPDFYVVIKDSEGTTISEEPQSGVIVDDTGLYTDEDGFYTLAWKHKGKQADYTVQPASPLPGGSQYEVNGGGFFACPDTACVVTVQLGKGVKFVEVAFLVSDTLFAASNRDRLLQAGEDR